MQITLQDCLFIFLKFISSKRKISCMQYVVVNAEPVSFFLFSIWIEVLTFICFVPVDLSNNHRSRWMYSFAKKC